jgi:dTDP-4-dehydrorhamnose 3,5-epimerase-like enzyme
LGVSLKEYVYTDLNWDKSLEDRDNYEILFFVFRLDISLGGAIMEIKRIIFDVKGDERGSLIALESGADIPFEIKRAYYIFGTKYGVVRGYHAHLELKQVLVCIHGRCTIVLDNGEERCEVPLCVPNEGLFLDSLVWREMKDFSPDSVLLVFASEHYNEADYIRKYDDFLQKVKLQTIRR